MAVSLPMEFESLLIQISFNDLDSRVAREQRSLGPFHFTKDLLKPTTFHRFLSMKIEGIEELRIDPSLLTNSRNWISIDK